MKDYSKLGEGQLQELRSKKIEEISRCNNIQMARKIALNSCYGALG
tara:strand:- start:1561 stop:1698 length:138 start_codon:yes stop_codon:yes gene_type:complete